MHEQTGKTQQNKNQSIANTITQKKSSSESTLQLVDNRLEVVAQRILQETAHNSPQAENAIQLQSMANNHSAQQQESIQKKENNTGLPDDLKSGMENLSGYSMDDVKVHRNSEKPAELQAHAYAQGTDIHLGAGQEKHLPHEAWHVVQQKQGRVKPTKQLKGRTNINDDAGLEREADVMGEKALSTSIQRKSLDSGLISESTVSDAVPQLVGNERLQDKSTFNDLDGQSKKIVSSEELENYGYKDDKAAGTEKQIETEGDVSWRSKVSGWFGDEGTWSKFLTAVELYNKAENITEKQQQLYILKKEAHEWLKQKEDKLKKGETSNPENDKKKYDTIQKFINLTTSNQPDIIAGFEALQTKITAFSDDVMGKRAEFDGLVNELKGLNTKVKIFKDTFPPAVNLHFQDEWTKIQEKVAKVSKNYEVEQKGKSIGEYLEVGDPSIVFNVAHGEVSLQGGLGVKIGGIEVDKGTKVKATIDSKGEYKSIEISDGALKVRVGDMEVELKKLNYASEILTAETASGKINILEKEVKLEVTNAKISKDGFDFDKITGALDKVDLEIVEFENPQLSFNKKENIFDGKFDYKLKLPNPLNEGAKSEGKFEFEWSPEVVSKRNFKLEKANFEFGLFGQTLKTKDTSYNHKDRRLDAKEAELTFDFLLFEKQKFVGKDISVGKTYFDFSELSAESQLGELPLGPLSITPKKYGLYKDDQKGYGVKAEGEGKLSLPKGFDMSASAEFEGAVAIYFKEKKPEVELTKGNANLEFANPLAELSKYLGDGWTNTRFELGAAIPLFPGVSAVFGLYLQLLATLPEKIKGSALLEGDKLGLSIGTKNKVGVEGGVFGGVQAGSQLLLALAALLRAAAKFEMDTEVGYKKKVDLKPGDKQKGNDEVKNTTDGFYYSIGGGLKAGVYLDLVATALYFFKKTFTLELKEWNLGEFKFTNKEDSLPDTESKELFKQEDLKDKLDPVAVSKNPEIQKLSPEQLLNEKDNQRYSGKEKEELLNMVTDAETGRSESLEKAKKVRAESKGKNGSLGAEEVFDNVALANMQFFDQYIDKFVTWDKVFEYLTKLNVAGSNPVLDERKKAIKENLMLLKDVLTIPAIFQKHFADLEVQFNQAYNSYSGTSLAKYKDYLRVKKDALAHAHKFKGLIHSQFWGDASKIDSNLRSWSFIGNSPLTDLINSYTGLYLYLLGVKDTLKVSDKGGRYKMVAKALKEMNKEHQKRMDEKRSKSISRIPS